MTTFSPGVTGDYTLALNPPAIEAACDDAVDDDFDGDVDCADSDCASDLACTSLCTLGDCCYADTLTFVSDPDSYVGALSGADATNGPRGSGYYFDDVEFTAVAFTPYVLEITSGTFDSYMYLLDDSCTVIASDDDGGDGLLSAISFTPTDNKTYTVIVTTFSSGVTGDYTLELNP